ncbi:ribonuclease [Rhodanobacter glycinis]|uniref:Ribonuclease n=1 Tax=Rhodanobacter glycinis TaxID=582702 RepID=A0A5B9E4N7_9GAMM|nr:ribonuclease [Rhodanobacter glycinis]QEE25116.1 ribonuclease [Rhodanobacter glycinis]
MRSWKPLLVVVILALAFIWQREGTHTTAPNTPNAAATAAGDTGLPAFLPPEARQTLTLIARGGPFPHHQDGVVFGNYEGLLPKQPRGYYHEYTVETPGARTRGTRRIITGGTPPMVYYYTDDHYRSFHRFSWHP